MTDQNTQTVANETEALATPAAEVTSAQTPDLDALLREFETQATPQTASHPATPASDDAVAKLTREIADMKFQMDFKPTLGRVRGDVSSDVLSDVELTGLIDAWAKDDPKLQSAWLNRASNPRAWAKVESALSDRLATKFKPRIDVQATADKEAVAAAVRGASTNRAPEEKPPNYGTMSDAEFRAEKAKHGL